MADPFGSTASLVSRRHTAGAPPYARRTWPQQSAAVVRSCRRIARDRGGLLARRLRGFPRRSAREARGAALKAVITGATGHIGRRLVGRLLVDGWSLPTPVGVADRECADSNSLGTTGFGAPSSRGSGGAPKTPLSSLPPTLRTHPRESPSSCASGVRDTPSSTECARRGPIRGTSRWRTGSSTARWAG
jgi:hypothetical protein